MDDIKIVGAEVNAVLNKISKKDYYKIPKFITELFDKYNDVEINKKVSKFDKLRDMEISKTAKDIIFLISLNYCMSEEDKNNAVSRIGFTQSEIKKTIEEIFKGNEFPNNDNYEK